MRLGAFLFLAGFFIASRCQSPLTLYLGFGVLCGLGSGLSYNPNLTMDREDFSESDDLRGLKEGRITVQWRE